MKHTCYREEEKKCANYFHQKVEMKGTGNMKTNGLNGSITLNWLLKNVA
jgi:hypothetical protein